ncbi:MAG TPA: copper transporter [Acidimicrobiia bacterium]|nr:copper transporter [Acidimicrobiia bacterium]
MINFRFHLISLIAVFLALTVGIVVGSTVVDQAIVDGLRATVDRVEAKADDTARENEALSDERDQMRALVDELAPHTVADHLLGVRVVLVAQRGVDGGVVDALREWLRSAGALAPAVVWLDGSWTLDDDEAVARMQEVTGSAADAGAVRTLALDLLAERLADSPSAGGTTDPSGPTTTSTPSTTAPESPAAADDILVALVDAGFVDVEGIDADALGRYPGGPTNAVLVGGPTAESPADVLLSLARGFQRADVATIVSEVFEDGTDEQGAERVRGASLAGIRDDDALAATIATVDNGELTEGAIAIVLALEALDNGTVGHYGYGDGAERVLPEPSGR